MKQACSSQISADSTASCKSDSYVSVPRAYTRSISFSALTDDCNIGDYAECGGYPSVMTEENSSIILYPESQFQATRDDAVLRYKEKRKARK